MDNRSSAIIRGMDITSEQDAINYVKANKQLFIQHVIDQYDGNKPSKPIAIFMAGTPGAGKTEVANSLIDIFDHRPVHIDADDFRVLVPGYTGSNSELVQRAVSLAVDKVLDPVVTRGIPFILDGTFAVGKAVANIKRAFRHGYDTQIYFIYQDPVEAWRFTQIREQKEGRRVPKEAFVHAYFTSRENVEAVMAELGHEITLHVIIKNYQSGAHETHANVLTLADVLPKLYTKEKLMELL